MTETVCHGLRAPQVLARIPGLTYKQLYYWSTTGRIDWHTHDEDGDRGSGIPYCWPLDQVEMAGRMLQYIRLGFTLDTATDLAHNPARLAAVRAALEHLATRRRQAS